MIKLVYSAGKCVVAAAVWLASITIDETTLIPIGSAIFVLLGVWSLSARLQKMEDGIKELNRRIKAMENDED